MFAKRKKSEKNAANYNMVDMVWDGRNQLISVARIGQSHSTKSIIRFFLHTDVIHFEFGGMDDAHKAIDFSFSIGLDFALLSSSFLV